MKLSRIASALLLTVLPAYVLGAQAVPVADTVKAEQPAIADSLAIVPRDTADSVAVEQKGTTRLLQPIASSYTFGEGAAARTVEQLSIPLVMIFPFHRRFHVDLSTAAAYTRVVVGGETVSEIYGGTDTQIRANFNIMMDHLALTLGINAPSGQYYLDGDQLEAAAQIGNDFLFFPTSSMGNGPAGTAGLAAAVQLLNWNIGFGGSLRRSMEFTPLGSGTTAIRYLPGDETRMRLSAERQLWLGTASLGITFAKFGEEAVDSTVYSTGDRVITNLAWVVPIRSASAVLSMWNLSRDAGEQLGGPAPRENVRNWSGALNLPVKRWAFQPSIESRRWESAGERAGELLNYSVSISIPIGANSILQPRYTSSSGRVFSSLDGTPTTISGWQGSLLIRRR